MINGTGLLEFSEVIDYFFVVLRQFVELMFSNWLLMFVLCFVFVAIVFDLILILRGKK